MNPFLYRHKSFFLKLKRFVNTATGFDVVKYPTDELLRRIKLLESHNIDVILDIGANIGQYGGEMRAIGFTGEIFSFEPTKDAFLKLQKNAASDPKWKVFHHALGEKDGESEINVSQNSVSSSLLTNLPQLTESAPAAQFIEKETIAIRTIDSIFENLGLKGKNIYMKIDTQGYEEMVLKGAENTLPFITGIQVEMSLVPSYEGAPTFETMKSLLTNLGFELHTLENGFYDKKTGRQLEMDGIFYKTKPM